MTKLYCDECGQLYEHTRGASPLDQNSAMRTRTLHAHAKGEMGGVTLYVEIQPFGLHATIQRLPGKTIVGQNADLCPKCIVALWCSAVRGLCDKVEKKASFELGVLD